MGVRTKPCQSSGKSFLKWNLSPNADKSRVHKSSALPHTKTICQIMFKYTAVYFNSSEYEWGYLVLTDTNTGGVSPWDTCVFSVCVVRLGRAHAKNTCNQQNSSFSFREREQYIHCAAGIWVDRTAAGSEIKESRERRFIYNSQRSLEQEDGCKLVLSRWIFKSLFKLIRHDFQDSYSYS